MIKYKTHSSNIQHFMSYRPFWDKCTRMMPKWLWILKGQKYPRIFSTTSIESEISIRFDLWPAVFGLHAIFETSAPNVSKMTLNTMRWSYPICFVKVPNFNPFCPTVSLLSYRPFWHRCTVLRQVCQSSSKWHWTLRDWRHSTYLLLLPRSPKSQSVLLYSQPFSSYRPL